MEEILYSLAVICFIYYCILVVYTKSVRSSFSWFWISCAAIFTLIGMITSVLPDWGVSIVYILFIGGLMFFVAMEIMIFGGMIVPKPKKKKTHNLQKTLYKKINKNFEEEDSENTEQEHLYSVLIVLGAHVNKQQPCDTLKRRLEKAVNLLFEDPELKVIVSGGRGKGEEISEAEAMKRYLKSYGIDEKRIILEDQSHSTRENLENCLEYIEDPGETIGIVTNNFHIYRAVKQAKICGYENPKPVLVSSDYILFLNYVVREFFSVINMYLTIDKMEEEEQRQVEEYKKKLEEHPLEALKMRMGDFSEEPGRQKTEENLVEVDKQKTEVL